MDAPTPDPQLADLQAALAAEKAKGLGLAKNLDDTQLKLNDGNQQLSQAESIASDDDATIKDLTAKLSAAQATIQQLTAEADKPPAHLTTQTSTTSSSESATSTTPQLSLLDRLVSFIKGFRP